jgi:hypothetical protein
VENRISKIIITSPKCCLVLGARYQVVSTPYYYKALQPNGRLGVWVLGNWHKVIFVPFAEFQVVEYMAKPNPAQYGFVSCIRYPQIRLSYFRGEEGRLLLLRHRKEYWDLA